MLEKSSLLLEVVAFTVTPIEGVKLGSYFEISSNQSAAHWPLSPLITLSNLFLHIFFKYL